ncbi:phosphotransferase [Paenibacillus sp. BC26]|uniref:phosphotransferase n=1 Tax=Paenibacillus sp. BC26 TaxID=1881032 RepID=UPI0008EE6319|nr:phosphotransferase [Paenibacillus sp. BC26]SFS63903.1 Phosphotransferase enzyme family protein [Paenibacillus sp. BC26]
MGAICLEVNYHIEDRVLAATLDREYGIQVESIHFIPMGDSAYSYGVNCSNEDRYYLKLFDLNNDRQRMSMERSHNYLPLTWNLFHQGLLQNITYPIKNRSGEFSTTCNEITLVLFNYIQGESLAEAYPFSEEILEHIAASVAAIHSITPSIDKTTVVAEPYDISFDRDLEKCISLIESTLTFDNPSKQALREHVLPKKEQILVLLNLVRKLRLAAMSETHEFKLCHGDVWGGNLIRHGNLLYVIDWESAIMAPIEFDMIGYIGEEFDVFFSAYEKHVGKSVAINPDLLRFYSYRHHLRNLTNWLMNILYRNTEDAQNENDLEMILYHCMNRWDHIEPMVKEVEANLRRRSGGIQ